MHTSATNSSSSAQSSSRSSSGTSPKSGRKPFQDPKTVMTTRFHKRLATIFAGKVSPKSELFEPLEVTDKRGEVVIGKIVDPKARELISLYRQLMLVNGPRVRVPRTPDDIKRAEAEVQHIERLAKTAKDLAWQIVGTQFPNEESRNLALRQGWVVVRKKAAKERMSEMLTKMQCPAHIRDQLLSDLPDDLGGCEGILEGLLGKGSLDEIIASLLNRR